MVKQQATASAAIFALLATAANGFPDRLSCNEDRLRVGGRIMNANVISSASRNLRAVNEDGDPVDSYTPGERLFIEMQQDAGNLRWHGRITNGAGVFANGDTCGAVQGSNRLLEVDTEDLSGTVEFQAGWAFQLGTVTLTPTLTLEQAPIVPTANPSGGPTYYPSSVPSAVPSLEPTATPSEVVSEEPTNEGPTGEPSPTPTLEPTISSPPSLSPSWSPSQRPSWSPSSSPTYSPSYQPSAQPTAAVAFPPNLEETGLRGIINDLDDAVTLQWEIIGEWLHFEMIVAKANQYVAYAWTSNDNIMLNADAVVGDETVERRRLAGRGPGQLLNNDLQNDEIVNADGVSILRFSRRLAATQGGEAVQTSGNDNCILSYGGAFPGSGGSPHGANRVAISINFETGDVSVEDDTDEMIIIHAVFMTLAWLLFAPLGIITAAFKDVFCTKSPGTWLKVHIVFQVLAVLCNFAGFWVIYDFVGDLELEENHHTIGFVIFIAANVQVIGGALRPHKPEPGEEPTIARFVFELFHKSIGYALVVMAHLNVSSGLDFASVSDGEDYQVIPLITGIIYISIIVGKYAYTFVGKLYSLTTEPSKDRVSMEEAKAWH